MGFPRESGEHERRTVLTPTVARRLAAAGFAVVAEAGVGLGVGIVDGEYVEAGVQVVDADAAWSCPLVLRYRSGPVSDIGRLDAGQAMGAIFHAEGDPAMLDALQRAGVRAYAYEFVTEEGRFPMAAPGGRIAGVQAVLAAAQALQTHSGGRGVLLSDVPDVACPRVVVIGSGNVGAQAARTAAALGASVIALTSCAESAVAYAEVAPSGVAVAVNTPERLQQELRDADVVIGAVLVSTYDTPTMITEDELTMMRPGAVIVDVTCGYGSGYLPTAGPVQSPGDLPLVVGGVLHVKLDSTPALVPVTTTQAFTATAAPYLVRLADHVLRGTDDAAIEAALIAADGRLVHPVVVEHAALYGVRP